MRCPNCGEPDSRVIDSRDLDEAGAIRRRRECVACGTRFTTYERVEAARLIVLKRDGRREEFDREKLVAGFRKSLHRRAVPPDAADRAADEIEAVLKARGASEVPSRDIGELAMDRLRELDQIAYMRFALVYQSYEDLGQLKREVDTLLADRGEPAPGQTQLELELEGDAAARAATPRRAARAARPRAPGRAAPSPVAPRSGPRAR